MMLPLPLVRWCDGAIIEGFRKSACGVSLKFDRPTIDSFDLIARAI
ncbi:MAG: hypothetical protein WC028_00360 [Candidatus Obscuribacterales bacterium]|jgi:hypothetical protein